MFRVWYTIGLGAEARQGWLNEQCHRLKHAGGAAVLRELHSLEPQPRSDAARETLRKTLGYFANHVHRMDYPTYLANGWQIGSGPIESSCKRVISHRMKCGGMRWREPGANGVSHLRALYLSDRVCWQSHWAPNHLQT